MFKRPFGRFVMIVSLGFVLFFVATLVYSGRQPIEDEPSEKSATVNDHGEEAFRLETLVGSILTGIR